MPNAMVNAVSEVKPVESLAAELVVVAREETALTTPGLRMPHEGAAMIAINQVRTRAPDHPRQTHIAATAKHTRPKQAPVNNICVRNPPDVPLAASTKKKTA